MFKKSKIFPAIALILLLCIANVIPALATNLNDDKALIGSEEKPVQAAISKVLRIPVETDIPDANFEFIATAVSIHGDTERKGPNLHNLGVKYPNTDMITEGPVNNVLSLVLETGNIFEGVDFPEEGIYVYTITENRDTNNPIDNDENQQLTYSGAEYELTVYVKNKEDGTGRYVYALGTLITIPGEGQKEGDKVDPTPGGYEDKYAYSRMIFTNDYVKTNPAGPQNGDSTLEISKKVTGDFADKNQLFNFTMTLQIPHILINPPEYYRAYIVEADGKVSDTYTQVSTTAETKFTLKDGQSLIFIDTPVGTAYEVTETGTTNYFASAVITTNGDSVALPEGDVGAALSTDECFVGEKDNSAAFTNRRDRVTPTGLNLNNLPFMFLIALSLGALTTFVVVRLRKKTNTN